MSWIKSIRQCLKGSVFFLGMMSGSIVYGAGGTIYENRIPWEKVADKEKLLATVPTLSEEAIRSLFEFYRNEAASVQEPDVNRFDIRFLNYYWGPLNNAFNQYPRLAKFFLFVEDKQTGTKEYYLALVIKNDRDKNYYIFDPAESQPILLDKWVKQLQGTQSSIHLDFNLCQAYGNYPTDSCTKKTYQAEVADSRLSTEPPFLASHPEKFSAYRAPQKNWQTVTNIPQDENTIFAESIAWDDKEARTKLLSSVPAWVNYGIIEENFEKIRNPRYFEDEYHPNFLRRITWLYPDDGCWTRASAVLKGFFGPFNNRVNKFSRPAKIFAFGNLCVNTNNSPNGKVTWWYHTAPIIKDAETDQTYVLDPSVDVMKPLTVEQWVSNITATTGQCATSPGSIKVFNICNGYGATPSSLCRSNFSEEVMTEGGQFGFRIREWSRQEELLWPHPEKVFKILGDDPPWEMGNLLSAE